MKSVLRFRSIVVLWAIGCISEEMSSQLMSISTVFTIIHRCYCNLIALLRRLLLGSDTRKVSLYSLLHFSLVPLLLIVHKPYDALNSQSDTFHYIGTGALTDAARTVPSKNFFAIV